MYSTKKPFDEKTAKLISQLDHINENIERVDEDLTYWEQGKYSNSETIADIKEHITYINSQVNNLAKVILSEDAYKRLLELDANRRMFDDGIIGKGIAAFIDWCWTKNGGRWPDGTKIGDD